MRALMMAGGLVLAIALAGGRPANAERMIEAAGIRVIYSGVSDDDAYWLLDELTAARIKLERYWGKTYDGPLTGRITDRRRVSMALLPAWHGRRGTLYFPPRLFRTRRVPTLHETVHIFAPNQNRFLAEGLATYLHDRLGGPPAFPNFGRPLDRLARAYSDVPLARLDAVALPVPLRFKGELTLRAAYLVAGSFVGFLIERYGLPRFRLLYDLTPMRPGERGGGGDASRYRAIYGSSLEALADQWRRYLAREAR
jgi:hypothetical protein